MSKHKAGLGVVSVCFGEYKCPQCNRIWESSKAWRDYGQKCKHCDKIVNASGLEELFNYICKPCYHRTKGKEGRWKYKLCKEGKNCRSCGENVKPFLTYSEFVKARRLWVGGSDHIDPKKTHKREMCEKCIRSGRYCANIVEPQSKVEFTYYKINKESRSQDVVGQKEKNADDQEKIGSPLPTGRISTGVTSQLSFRQVASIGIVKPSSSTSAMTYNSSTGERNMSALPSKTGRSGFRTLGGSRETTSFRSEDKPSASGNSGVEPVTNTGNKHIRKNKYLASQEGTLSDGYRCSHNSSRPAINPNDQNGGCVLLVLSVIIIFLLFMLEKLKENVGV